MVHLINYFNHPDSVFYGNYRRQLAAALSANLIALSHGIGLGWVAPMLLTLQSPGSPLDFKVSVEEASSIGAFVSVGGLIGNILFGTLLDIIGRKKCLYLLAVPHICFWATVYFANDVYWLYIARVLGGTTGGGTYLVIPIFVAEIADPKVRGTLVSMFSFSLATGMLLGNIISSHIAYHLIPCLVMVLPVLFIFLIFPFPETPQHLLRKQQSDAAEKSLRYYKNIKDNSKDEQLQFDNDFNEMKMSVMSTKNKQKLSLDDIFSKQSVKALLTGTILATLFGFVGIFAIVNYSSLIFAEANASMDPNTNTIIIGAFQILGCYSAFVLIDKYGRKFLLLLSTIGMCIGYTMIGVYSYNATETIFSNAKWLPVVFMSLIVLAANIGIVPVSFIVMVEILPQKIRSFGATLSMVVSSISITVVVKAFPLLMVQVGLSGVMWMFGIVNAVGFIFYLVVIRETKGKNLDDESAFE